MGFCILCLQIICCLLPVAFVCCRSHHIVVLAPVCNIFQTLALISFFSLLMFIVYRGLLPCAGVLLCVFLFQSVWSHLRPSHHLLSVAVVRLRLQMFVDVCLLGKHDGNTWVNQIVTITWRIKHVYVYCSVSWFSHEMLLHLAPVCFLYLDLLSFMPFVYACSCLFALISPVCYLLLFAFHCFRLLAFACA